MDGLEASSVCTVRQRSEERRTKSEEEPSVGEVEEHGRREDKWKEGAKWKVEGMVRVAGQAELLLPGTQ